MPFSNFDITESAERDSSRSTRGTTVEKSEPGKAKEEQNRLTKRRLQKSQSAKRCRERRRVMERNMRQTYVENEEKIRVLQSMLTQFHVELDNRPYEPTIQPDRRPSSDASEDQFLRKRLQRNRNEKRPGWFGDMF